MSNSYKWLSSPRIDTDISRALARIAIPTHPTANTTRSAGRR